MSDPLLSFSAPGAEAQLASVAAPEVLGIAVSHDFLLTACAVLALLALAAVICILSSRRQMRAAARAARERSQAMANLLRTVRMAESIAELGVWQYEPATGLQTWSAGMRAIFGIAADQTFVEGDAETLLFANDIDLVANVMLHREETEPYTLHFDVVDREGMPRCLAVQAFNLRNASGGIARVIAVVRNLTDQVLRERELTMSRALALSEARAARELAFTDPLTGLANRRRIMSELDRLVLRARRSDYRLALILFDLDHFKTINDTHGHVLGDKVLRRVAEIAREQARGTDLVGRVGGEEFVWIVPHVDEESAHLLAERLRQAIAMQSAVEQIAGVTASVGCAELLPGDSSLSLFARADTALYAAKNAGRNRVRLAA